MTTVGFIGVGQLGEPMVRKLIAAGTDVVVYVRNQGVRRRLEECNVRFVESPAALAAVSDVLIACLFSDRQLRDVALGPDGLVANAKPGADLISHVTGSPSTLRELACSHPAAPNIVEAPVSGNAEDIMHGRLTVLLGGASHALDRATTVVSAYADPVIRTGELGSALRIKLINNALLAANSQMAAAAVQLAEQFGTADHAILQALSACSGGSRAAEYIRDAGSIHDFGAQVAPFIRKDFAAVLEVAEATGIDLGLIGDVVRRGPLELLAAD